MRAGRPGFGSALLLVVGLSAACGGSPTTAASTSAPGPAATPSTLQPPAVTLSEADNGRTAAVGRGAEITVVLHNTYWSLVPLSGGGAVEMLGSPVVAPEARGCVPGRGCGTVTVHYRARVSGQSVLAAHRTICGEARACAPDQRDWRVTVAVTP